MQCVVPSAGAEVTGEVAADPGIGVELGILVVGSPSARLVYELVEPFASITVVGATPAGAEPTASSHLELVRRTLPNRRKRTKRER